jgi:hypothetical protein
MASIFGHAWVSQYGASPDGVAGDTWSAALAGLLPSQIGVGLDAVVRLGEDWPPSVSRFRALCLGIPAFAVVRRQLRPGAPKLTPFARAMWTQLDPWRYRQADADRQERMAKAAYEVVCDMVQHGEALPQEPEALLEQEPQPKHVPAPAEVAKRHLDEIAEQLRVRIEEGEA